MNNKIDINEYFNIKYLKLDKNLFIKNIMLDYKNLKNNSI